VVLERVEVARLGAEVERDLSGLTGRAWVIGGELAALPRLAVATSARGKDDGPRLDHMVPADCAPS
jgi:hypothetical protein